MRPSRRESLLLLYNHFSVTDPLYRPFRGIVASPTAEGGYTLALPIVIAIIVYALVHAGINGLLRLIAHRNTEI